MRCHIVAIARCLVSVVLDAWHGEVHLDLQLQCGDAAPCATAAAVVLMRCASLLPTVSWRLWAPLCTALRSMSLSWTASAAGDGIVAGATAPGGVGLRHVRATLMLAQGLRCVTAVMPALTTSSRLGTRWQRKGPPSRPRLLWRGVLATRRSVAVARGECYTATVKCILAEFNGGTCARRVARGRLALAAVGMFCFRSSPNSLRGHRTH